MCPREDRLHNPKVEHQVSRSDRYAAGADQFDVYAGNSNPELARNICRYLNKELGQAEVFQFANENIFVRIIDNAREKDVFLIQPTSHPVNKSIMEPPSCRTTATAARTRRTSPAFPSRPG